MKKRVTSLLIMMLMICAVIPFAAIPVAAAEEPALEFLDYLDVGAGAYIDTGYVPTKNTRVVMDMELDKLSETALFGVSTDLLQGYALYSFDKGQLVSYYGNGGKLNAGTLTNGRHTVETNKNLIKIDGVQTCEDESRTVSVGDHTMYLFAVNNIDGNKSSAWAGNGQSIRFYSCQIHEGEKLVRDFIPARKGNEIGVYDNKEGKFYAKQGGGTMTDPVTVYDCLDVGEGAYINTNYKPKSNTRVVFDAEVVDDAAVLFGVDFPVNNVGVSFYVNAGYYENAYVYGSGWGPGDDWGWNGIPLTHERQTVELSPGQFKSGDKVKNYSSADFASTLPMYLFAINFFGNDINTFSGQHIRFYSCKIYEGNELIHEFVPAKRIDGFGVCDTKDNNKFYKNQGDGYMVGYQKVNAGGTLPSGNEGVILDFDGEITVSENTTINALPGQSGIVIAGGRNVTINIKEGKTLTVTGGAAIGRYGAGAGIEVPETSSLTIRGDGTLEAFGGDAAVGAYGRGGGDAYIAYKSRDGEDMCYSGAGGKGGDGGGGAGAGIGGRGGEGGIGGKGGASAKTVTDSGSIGAGIGGVSDVAMANGVAGSAGTNGTAGGACGNITIANTLTTVTATGGKAPESFSFGGMIGSPDEEQWWFTFMAFGGGGGGGGGNGYAAADYGAGGAGAGGGGGGGSGLIVYWFDPWGTTGTGHGGIGGAGSQSGQNGRGIDTETHTEGLVSGAGGKGGNAGGGAGAKKTPEYYNETAVKPQLADNAQNFLYNGKVQNGIINLDDCEKYTISGTVSAQNAGEYSATFKPKKGCVWSDGTCDELTFNWSIEKQTVKIPSKNSFHFTGSPMDVVEDSPLYTVDYEGGKKTEIGENYSVKLILNDKVNYVWENMLADDIIIKYDIHIEADTDGDHWCDICGELLLEHENLTESITTLNGGNWHVSGILNYNGWINIYGNVSLYLADNSVLTVKQGIIIQGANSSLTIYAQSDGENMGKLISIGGDGRAGIGSGDLHATCGNITINGGDITASCSYEGAGIGSGFWSKCGDITINGGIVKATGNSVSAGIGSGYCGSCGKITVNGGNIIATGGQYAAGIGNGDMASCGKITISDDLAVEAGETKDKAEKRQKYQNEPYAHIYFCEHEWQYVDGLYHKCAKCDKIRIHIDENGDRVCEICGGFSCVHEHTTISYVWNDKYTKCTATRYCDDCNNILLSETATKIELIDDTPDANCQTMGKAHYEATFESFEKAKTAKYGVETKYGEHNYVDCKCTVCFKEQPLDEAKADLIAAIDAAAGNSTSIMVRNAVDAAKEEIDSARTIEDVLKVRDKYLADIKRITGSGSVLSEGSLAIIVGVAALVLGFGGGFFLCKIVEKKKKQPEVTGDTEKETDDE